MLWNIAECIQALVHSCTVSDISVAGRIFGRDRCLYGVDNNSVELDCCHTSVRRDAPRSSSLPSLDHFSLFPGFKSRVLPSHPIGVYLSYSVRGVTKDEDSIRFLSYFDCESIRHYSKFMLNCLCWVNIMVFAVGWS